MWSARRRPALRRARPAISIVFDGTNIGNLGASGAAARELDELQFTLGEGPCLDAVARRMPIFITDLTDPEMHQWPDTLSAPKTGHQRPGRQLDVAPAVALLRPRAHAYATGRSATGRSATDTARDILAHRLTLEAH